MTKCSAKSRHVVGNYEVIGGNNEIMAIYEQVNCLSVFILYRIATIFHCSTLSLVKVFPVVVYLCCLVYTEGR